MVDGRYRVRGRVARGGMATVYTAIDERLERVVALKIIQPDQADDPSFLDRFTHEAKTIARLTHPNVVAVYDQGQHEGRPYLVMEYVRGRTLREVLAERRRLDPVEALAVAEQVLAALAAAHRAGLVHRDVKPENILVAEAPHGGPGRLVDAVVKVADFGLASAVEASADDPGALMATVAYVAPELVSEGTADARADVYSAGIVLFEMLTGRVPYDGARPVDVAWQHVDSDVPAPSRFVPQIPGSVDDLVVQATRRSVDSRPSDAGAMLTEVSQLRERLGSLTATMRSSAERTMVVPPVSPTRQPQWAAGARASRARRAATDQQSGGLVGLRERAAALGANALSWTQQHFPALPQAFERHRRALVPALSAAMVLLLVGTVWWFASGRYTDAPELVNLDQAVAAQRARDAGLTLHEAAARYDESVAKGVVLSQQPAASGDVVRGGTITVVLSLGPERLPVPDIAGKTFEMAKSELESLRLVAKRGTDKYHDMMPAGVVVGTTPEIGTAVKPGATVTVVVSKGKAPITVPRVIGQLITTARPALEALGLVVLPEPTKSDRPLGEILDQSLTDGTGVERGVQITLKVSEGPPAVPMPRVVDRTCEDGKDALAAVGLKVRVLYRASGYIRAQEPIEGTAVAPGTEVKIACF